MGKKLTAAGGFCWGGRQTDRALSPEHCSSLVEGRKWLCLLCNTDVCVQPGPVGKGGRGGGDNMQVIA